MEENKKEFPDVYGVIVMGVGDGSYPWTVSTTVDTPTEDADETADTAHWQNELADITDDKLCEFVGYELARLGAGMAFRMSVPVNYRDTDVLLPELLRRFKAKIEEQ